MQISPHSYEKKSVLDSNMYVVESHLDVYEESRISKDYSVKFVANGIEKYTINNRVFNLAPQYALLVNPANQIAINIRSNVPVRGTCFFFKPGLVAEAYASIVLSDEALLEEKSHFPANDFEFLTGLYPISTDVTKKHSENATEVLFDAIRNSMQTLEYVNRLGTARKSTREEIYWKIRRTLDLIHDTFSAPLNIEALALEAGLSKFHYLRSFKSIVGVTPGQYQSRYRIQQSTGMLNSKQPIGQIAADLGYPDLPTFSKAFKRYFGIPPTSFTGKN